MSRFDWDKYNKHRQRFERNRRWSARVQEWYGKWGGVAWLAALLLAMVVGIVYEVGWRQHRW